MDELRGGSLNRVTCPHCGGSGPAGAPLIFHDGQTRRVIFAGVPGAAEHEIRDQARHLHTLLVESIPEEQRRAYLADVDIAQDVDGMTRMLKRADRRRGGETPDRGVSPTETPPLLVAVQELLEARSPENLDRVIATHPALLARDTDTTLAQLADVAVEQRAYDIAESLQQARRLLSQSAGAVISALPDPTLQALMQAQSGADLLDVTDVHPLLLRPEVDKLLAEQINLALDAGNDRLASALEERREALAELRTTASGEPTLEEAIEALLSANGEDDLADVLDHYPLLLDEVASQALWQFAAEARASGDEEMARYAIECRELLRRVREGLDG